MPRTRPATYLESLVRELRQLPRETEWVEFKVNDGEPQEIGEYLSALANSASLLGKPTAYLVWGVENETHKLVGTSFDPGKRKIGNEELLNWLERGLTPKIDFSFHEVEIEGRRVVVLEIDRATQQPVQFNGTEHIRIGSYKKKLREHTEKERALWRMFDRQPFEKLVAAEHVSDGDVLQLLDYPSYFGLMKKPLPETRTGILDALAAEAFIERCDAGGWNILNLGAILFAQKLSDFSTLRRKGARVIHYRGRSRAVGGKEREGFLGYASGFQRMVEYVNGLLPVNEVMGQALRKDLPMYPPLAVREIIANAIIHQDFTLTGTGPMVEIFEDRIEVTNPGKSLMDPQRFVDMPPRSRNETLASLMRRLGICEERGSGWDKVVEQTEFYQLPPPTVEQTDEHLRVTLFAHRPLAEMDRSQRVHACYLHASLKHVMRDYLTNASLRQRFGIMEHNKAAVSRYIREAVEAEVIRPFDEDAGRKYMKYVPYWA